MLDPCLAPFHGARGHLSAGIPGTASWFWRNKWLVAKGLFRQNEQSGEVVAGDVGEEFDVELGEEAESTGVADREDGGVGPGVAGTAHV